MWIGIPHNTEALQSQRSESQSLVESFPKKNSFSIQELKFWTNFLKFFNQSLKFSSNQEPKTLNSGSKI